jgi:hypothetical protein
MQPHSGHCGSLRGLVVCELLMKTNASCRDSLTIFNNFSHDEIAFQALKDASVTIGFVISLDLHEPTSFRRILCRVDVKIAIELDQRYRIATSARLRGMPPNYIEMFGSVEPFPARRVDEPAQKEERAAAEEHCGSLGIHL